MSDEMTDKMEFFCREYLTDFNATQAAIRAGYSADSAGAIGHENLTKPEIQKRITALKLERAAALGITADRVLQEISRIAFVDVRRIVKHTRKKDRNGKKLKTMHVEIADFDDVSADDAAAIAGVVQTKGKSPKIEVKFHDKTKALDALAKHVGLYKDSELNPNVTVINLTPDFGTRPITPGAAVGTTTAPPSGPNDEKETEE